MLLDEYIAGGISVGGLNQINKIISKQMSGGGDVAYNDKIKEKLAEITNSSNSYASNLTKNFLKTIR